MRYGDLIQFEPLESVMQLKETAREERARDFISTYVISRPMADNLTKVIFKNLQFSTPADSKGIFIVGNYGTGKSHLMGVIASVAENSELRELLTDESVRESAIEIAGNFKVIRSEIGATEMPLRDIILSELKTELHKMGVEFDFPPIDKASNNKETLEEMMSSFCKKFPDKGLMMVVDELLDYLRNRKEQLILDMTFLREIGEFCKNSRFRFIAGIQEALYDNPTFEFASDAVRRVKDRFIDVRIAREDIEFVVANRLLKKTDSQKAKVREHLQNFTKYYGTMNEKLDTFVNLFPVHPSFIGMFERIRFIEHREVLQTLTKVMSELLDREVPEGEPGIVSYDTYWDRISSRSDLVTVPEIRLTKEKSEELTEKTKANIDKHHLDNALRIIKTLSVHRLSTSDIDVKVGPTVDELRDDLLIFNPAIEDLGGNPMDDLSTMIEGILKKIINIVSGQYVAYIKENGQYYLDLNKTIDFNSQIEKKRDTLGNETFNRYYFTALAKLMECSDKTYVPGHKIWQYELIWQSKNTTRFGYLFFGQPNERSTAQPPRDFYIYFLPIYKIHPYKDEGRDDEVFFAINDIDREFEENLKNYAASIELSQTAASYKETYRRISDGYVSKLTMWLNENLASSFSVTYKKSTKSIPESYALRNKPFRQLEGFKEIIDDTSSLLLDSHFSDTALGYPQFQTKVTSQNRSQLIESVIKGMTSGNLTRQNKEVLSSLDLIDENGKITTAKSIYTKGIMSKLTEKASGSVLNRNELFVSTETGEFLMPYRLEPEWAFVLLAVMLYMGEIELSLAGEQIDASSFEKLMKLKLEDLVNFRNIRLPRDLPVSTIKELFSFLKINEGQVSNLQNGDPAPVENMLRRAQSHAEELAKLSERIKEGFYFWEEPLITTPELEKYLASIKKLREFFDSLTKYSTVGKLKNLRISKEDIVNMSKEYEGVRRIKAIIEITDELNSEVSYLQRAKEQMISSSPWLEEYEKKRKEALAILKDKDQRTMEVKRTLNSLLGDLKFVYIKAYMDLHSKARLDVQRDKQKSNLLSDYRFRTLNKLSTIEMLSKQQLEELTNKITRLKTCYGLTESSLEKSPFCPTCEFKPAMESSDNREPELVLDGLDRELDGIFDSWKKTILANLKDPVVSENIELLEPGGKSLIEKFIDAKQLKEELVNNPAFTKALTEVFSTLEKIELTTEELQERLFGDHAPKTPQEMRKRFEELIEEKTRGKDVNKVRIILKEGEK
ncbi:MAG: DUF6079 family protein [Mesotoga sp.]